MLLKADFCILQGSAFFTYIGNNDCCDSKYIGILENYLQKLNLLL